MARTVDTSSTFENWRQKYNELANDVGGLGDLRTGVTSSIVDAVNYIQDQYFFFQDFDFDGSDGATSNTVFSGTDNAGATLSYAAGKVLVYKNGLLLRSGSDYTATNGTSVVLASSANNGDVIRISSFTGSYQGVGGAGATSGTGSFLLNGGVLYNKNTDGIIFNADNTINSSLEHSNSFQFENVAYFKDEIYMKATGSTPTGINFQDADNSNLVQLKAPATISSNFSLILPTADGSSGQFLRTDGSGQLSFATVSSTAPDITVTANNSTDETVFPLFVDGATGTQGVETDSGFTYNPSSGVLTATQFTGALSGNASTATALASARNIHGVAFDGTGNIDLSEVIQDTVGAMFSSNTETNITATYQDSDGTIDLVLDTAQPNITSLGTLTTLTVDDISIDGSTISDAGVFKLDIGSHIILDADGGNIYLSDGGTDVGVFQLSNSSLVIRSLVSDEDILFKGNDGGSAITALTLDMSDAGSASFNNDVTVGGNLVVTGTTTQTGSLVSNTNFQGLSQSNSGNSTDFGFFGKYVESSTTKYAGLFFDASTDNTFRLYTDSQTAPSTTVNTSATGYAAANIVLAQVDNTQTNVSQSARVAQVALTSSSNAVAWDAKAAQNAYHVTTENTTFSAPSNAVEGAVIQVELAQGGTARTIAWNTVFEFAASTAPTVTATANKTDIFTFRYNGSVWQEIGRVQNMAQT